VVSEVFYPDDTALSSLEQDVTQPWTGNSTSSYVATLTQKARTRTFTIATPLDGTFRATVTTARGERVRLTLTGVGSSTRSVGTTICGTRSYTARITLLSGTGRVRLSVSKP
jgi:hypothetical protein